MGEIKRLKQNIGDTDRMIRFGVAAAMLFIPVVLGRSRWTVAMLAALAGAQLIEAAIRY